MQGCRNAQASHLSPGTSAFGDTGDAVVLGSSSGRSDLSSLSSHRVVFAVGGVTAHRGWVSICLRGRT